MSKGELLISNRLLQRVRGRDRQVRKYLICPADVLNFAKTYPVTTNRDLQDVAYVLFKSATALRVSSILKVKNNYPGIKMGDIVFYFENDPCGQKVLSLKVMIKHEKHVKESGSEKYAGREIKLYGRNDSACPVKLVFLQCLYLNIFTENCAIMMKTGNFEVKADAKETNLFRLTDSHSQFTTRPLIQDSEIMDRFAIFLGLPTYCVSGHCLRHGTASRFTDVIIKSKKGIDAPTITGSLKAMGGWKGRGFLPYIASMLDGRINLTETAFGDQGEVMCDPIQDRHSLFGLSSEEYLMPESPIIIAAVSRSKSLDEEKIPVEKARKLFLEFCDKFRIPYEKTGRSVKKKNAMDALSTTDKRTYFELRHKLHLVVTEYRRKVNNIRANFASYGNKYRLELNRQTNKLKYRRDLKTSQETVDFQNLCESVETYRKTKAKFFFGAFTRANKIGPETMIQCWVKNCTMSFLECDGFIHHMDRVHNVVPYTPLQTGCVTFRAQEELQHAAGDEKKDNERMCFECPVPVKQHSEQYRGNYPTWYSLTRHFRVHWIKYECSGCGIGYNYTDFNQTRTSHDCTSVTPTIVSIEPKIVTITDFLLSCSHCQNLRTTLNVVGCLAKTDRVAEILKEVPVFTKAAQRNLKEKYELSSQDCLLSQGGTAAQVLCEEYGLQHLTEETAIQQLTKNCKCVADEINTRKLQDCPAFKIAHPDNFYILRGNHECVNVNLTDGFFDECERRYDEAIFWKFNEAFEWLPVAGLVGGRVFCVHGGLSPELKSFDQIRRIPRPIRDVDGGMIADLLWSDPAPAIKGYVASNRGVGFMFGADAVVDFCNSMDVDLVVRSNQVVMDGYEFFAEKRLVTLFSAPKYCDQYDNAAAMMHVDENMQRNIKQLTK